MNKKYYSILWAFILLPLATVHAQKNKIKLFQPNKQNDWYVFLSKTGKNNDSLHVFQFEKDVLHVSGEDFGYIMTTKKFKNFHFTVEFKWGEKKYPPREKDKRDSGIMYLIDLHDGDKVWPRSVEFQIQEGDCGDFWMIDSASIVYKNKRTEPKNYYRQAKVTDAEKAHGEWNKAEVIVKAGQITHKLNGVIVNEGSDASIKEGQILLQSEGAELYYKNAVIEEFD